MNNIKDIYQHAGNFDDQKNLKDILDDSMLLNTEEVTDDSPNMPIPSTPVKKQVLVNQCVYSPTYLMLKIKHKNFVLELKNTNVETLKWVIAFGPRKQNEKGIQK